MSSDQWVYPHVSTSAGQAYLPAPEPVYVDARRVRDLTDERDRARGVIAEVRRILTDELDESCPGAALDLIRTAIEQGN